jgi:hypothetical protein
MSPLSISLPYHVWHHLPHNYAAHQNYTIEKQMQLTFPMFKRFSFLPRVQRVMRISQNERFFRGPGRAVSNFGMINFPFVKTG